MAIAEDQKSITRNYLLPCGIIAAPIFLLLILIEGYIREDYNALRYPLSSLSFGEHAWMQNCKFYSNRNSFSFFFYRMAKLELHKGEEI